MKQQQRGVRAPHATTPRRGGVLAPRALPGARASRGTRHGDIGTALPPTGTAEHRDREAYESGWSLCILYKNFTMAPTQRERIHAGRRVDTTDNMRLIQTALRDWPAPHTIPARAPYGHASLLHRRIGGTKCARRNCHDTGDMSGMGAREHTPRDDGLLAYISHPKGARVQSRGNTHTRTCDMTFTAVYIVEAYRMVGDDPAPSVTPAAAPGPPAAGPEPPRMPPPPPTTPPRPRRGNPPARLRPAQVGLYAAQMEQRARPRLGPPPAMMPHGIEEEYDRIQEVVADAVRGGGNRSALLQARRVLGVARGPSKPSTASE